MFAIESLSDVPKMLSHVYGNRVRRGQLPEGFEELRGPVGLFVIRKDGASGSKLAEEVVGSFGYWDTRSSYAFDGVFLGWGYDACPVFRYEAFGKCIDDLEFALDWAYEGGANLLLTDFVYQVKSGQGQLDFSRSIALDISQLMKKEKFDQLSPLLEVLIQAVRDDRDHEPNKSVWEISDYVALLRTREWAWQTLVEKIGGLLGWVDEVRPYAVRDLRRKDRL